MNCVQCINCTGHNWKTCPKLDICLYPVSSGHKVPKKYLLPEEEEPHFPSSSKVFLHVEIIEIVINLMHDRNLDKKAWNFHEPMENFFLAVASDNDVMGLVAVLTQRFQKSRLFFRVLVNLSTYLFSFLSAYQSHTTSKDLTFSTIRYNHKL